MPAVVAGQPVMISQAPLAFIKLRRAWGVAAGLLTRIPSLWERFDSVMLFRRFASSCRFFLVRESASEIFL